MTDLAFSRRHLFKAAGIVASGVLAKTVSAQARTWGNNYKHESLMQADTIYYPQYGHDSLVVEHCFNFEWQGGVCSLSQTELDHAVTYANANHEPLKWGPCFMQGTNIHTAAGERPIEELDSDDCVLTLSNGVQPIDQVFHYVYPKPWYFALQPVRISKNALADGVPSRDLIVSQEHAVMVDGVLVAAGSLINDITILQHTVDCDVLKYYHIALANPDIIIAENTPTESLALGEKRLPVLSFHRRGRERLGWHLRSALSPWIDIRHPLDRICDRLAERAAIA